MQGQNSAEGMISFWNNMLAQPASQGAWPTLFAATDPSVNGCDYIGPTGLFSLRGVPGKLKANRRAYDRESAAYLWDVSEALTGVKVSS